jgi:hypothetical protein
MEYRRWKIEDRRWKIEDLRKNEIQSRRDDIFIDDGITTNKNPEGMTLL